MVSGATLSDHEEGLMLESINILTPIRGSSSVINKHKQAGQLKCDRPKGGGRETIDWETIDIRCLAT